MIKLDKLMSQKTIANYLKVDVYHSSQNHTLGIVFQHFIK